MDYGECFGQYPVSLEGFDSGSGTGSGLEGLCADFFFACIVPLRNTTSVPSQYPQPELLRKDSWV